MANEGGTRKSGAGSHPAGEPGKAAAQDAAVAQEAAGAPAVVVLKARKSGKKKKRKYTRGLKDLQRWERGGVRASNRLVDAVASGLTDYRKRSNRSARKKRDGAVRDALDNLGRAAGKTLRRSSKAPFDLLRRASLSGVRWRDVRGLTRWVASPFGLFLR